MAESAKRKGCDAVRGANRSSKSLPNRSAQATEGDIARRAYELYLTRGCEHGHDVEDWLQAERELMWSGLPLDISKDRHDND